MLSFLDTLLGQVPPQSPYQQGYYPPLLPPTGMTGAPTGPPTDLYGNPGGPPMWEYGRMLPFQLANQAEPWASYWQPRPLVSPYQPPSGPGDSGPGYGGMTVDEGGGSPLYELIQRLHQLWGR